MVKSSRKSSAVPEESNYDELLKDGVSRNRDYIALKQKSRSPVRLQFKPFIFRSHAHAVYVGGKLAAFPDDTHEAWVGLGTRAKQELLKTSFEGLPQDRVSDFRVGSNVGLYVLAGSQDGEKFYEKVDFKKLVKEMLDSIEKTLSIEIENRIDVTKWLVLQYTTSHNGSFGDYGSSLGARMIGKKSGIVFGQNAVHGASELSEFLEKHALVEPAETTED